MEVWQYSLMALLSASGIIIGFFIGKFTHSEVLYARRYLTFFCGLFLIAGVVALFHGMISLASLIIPGFALLFIGLLMLGSIISVNWHK